MLLIRAERYLLYNFERKQSKIDCSWTHDLQIRMAKYRQKPPLIRLKKLLWPPTLELCSRKRPQKLLP